MKNSLIALFFLLSVCLYAEPKYQMGICSIFQNEAPFIKEWIDYHIKVGVEHFWLYNNNSEDNYKEVLLPYLEKGLIDLIEWPSYQFENDFQHFSFEVQTSSYNHALTISVTSTKWLALIDIDEFIVPICNSTIQEVLENHYSNCSGVCVNWQCYGTSHVSRCNPGEMLEMLTLKMRWDHPRNRYYKSIVKPKDVLFTNNPHFCIYHPGNWHVNAIHEKIDVENTGIYIDKIRINHYWTRDEHFLYNIKIPRYQKWGGNQEDILNLSEEMNEEYDDCILRLK